MNFTVIPEEKLKQIETELAEIKNLLLNPGKVKPSDAWLS